MFPMTTNETIRKNIKSLLAKLETLSVKQVFIIYKQLAHDLAPKLQNLGLLN